MKFFAFTIFIVSLVLAKGADTDDSAVDSITCFSTYTPMLNAASSAFSTQYKACLTIAHQQTTNLITQMQDNKAVFIQQTTSMCQAYQNCNSVTDLAQFFTCYSSVSSQDVNVLYNVSYDATADAASYVQGLEVIQTSKDKCTNATENTFIKDTAETYELLKECLANGLPSTDAPAGTTTTTTATTTTAAPTTVADSDAPTAQAAAGSPTVAAAFALRSRKGNTGRVVRQ